MSWNSTTCTALQAAWDKCSVYSISPTRSYFIMGLTRTDSLVHQLNLGPHEYHVIQHLQKEVRLAIHATVKREQTMLITSSMFGAHVVLVNHGENEHNIVYATSETDIICLFATKASIALMIVMEVICLCLALSRFETFIRSEILHSLILFIPSYAYLSLSTLEFTHIAECLKRLHNFDSTLFVM